MPEDTGGAATATADAAAAVADAAAATATGGDAAAQAAAATAAAASASGSSTEYDLLSAEEQTALTDPGKKALQTERTARRDAERQLADQATRLSEFEDRDKTDQQKLEERATGAEGERDEWKSKFLRLKVSTEKGLPIELADLLQGDDETKLAAHAEVLLKHVNAGGGSGGDNGHDQGARGSAAPKSMNELIRERLGRSS
jgi:hypothetical protein